MQLEPEYIISETINFLTELSKLEKIYVEDLWYLNGFTEKALAQPEIYGDCRKVYEDIQNDLGGVVVLDNYYMSVEFEPGNYLERLRKFGGEQYARD